MSDLSDAEVLARFEAQIHALPAYPPPPPQPVVVPVVPDRRRVGLGEALRGVECCDTRVRTAWGLWRAGFFMVVALLLVMLLPALMFGKLGVIVVVGILCGVCLLASYSILGGSASPCP